LIGNIYIPEALIEEYLISIEKCPFCHQETIEKRKSSVLIIRCTTCDLEISSRNIYFRSGNYIQQLQEKYPGRTMFYTEVIGTILREIIRRHEEKLKAVLVNLDLRREKIIRILQLHKKVL